MGASRLSPLASGAGGLLIALFLGCGGAPDYSMDAPAAFKRFTEKKDFRFITADGVMLKAREVENYPIADLSFWVDAMQRHLEKRGYTFRGKDCFDTRKGLKACTLEFMLPYGAEDWVMSETLYVVGERIVLVESAGPFERYEPVKAQLRTALRSFDPGKKK